MRPAPPWYGPANLIDLQVFCPYRLARTAPKSLCSLLTIYPIYFLYLIVLYLTLPGHSLHSFCIIIYHRIISCRIESYYGNTSHLDRISILSISIHAIYQLYHHISIALPNLIWSHFLILYIYIILTSLSLSLVVYQSISSFPLLSYHKTFTVDNGLGCTPSPT